MNDYEAKNQPRQQEARVVSLKNPDQVSSTVLEASSIYQKQALQNGSGVVAERESKSSESNPGLAGVDVFFAKQLLRRHGGDQSDKVKTSKH